MDLIAVALSVWFGGSILAILGERLWTGSPDQQATVIRQVREVLARSHENCLIGKSVTGLRACGGPGSASDLGVGLDCLATQGESLLRELACLSEGVGNLRVTELKRRLKSLSSFEVETIKFRQRALRYAEECALARS